MNVSSVVIKCAPEYLEDVLQQLRDSGECEVYAHDELGRIIIVLEGETTEEESGKLARIQQFPHVLSAEMVYAFSEDEFSAEADKFEAAAPGIVDFLNDDGVDAKDIAYHGHLKDK